MYSEESRIRKRDVEMEVSRLAYVRVAAKRLPPDRPAVSRTVCKCSNVKLTSEHACRERSQTCGVLLGDLSKHPSQQIHEVNYLYKRFL
jgi:hypothetical protein